MNERRFGILIANSQFEEPNLENLRFPENDVDELRKILESKDHGCFTETIVLKEKAHYQIELKVNQMLKNAGKNDLVLIYYSGHGKLDSEGGLHLATANTTLNALESTSVAVYSLKKYMDFSPTRKVILMLDCCFGGAAGGEFTRGGVDDQLQLVSRGRGTYIMTASTGIQVAKEKEVDRHGVFTKHIIEGIRDSGADLNCDGEITMDELYRYVHDRVLDEGPQEPMKWDLDVRGKLVIARSAKSLREERMREIRSILSDLFKEGLPDAIFDRARHILSLRSDQISGNLCEYDALLDRLKSGSITSLEFVHEWNIIEKKDSRKQLDFEIKKPRSDRLDEAETSESRLKPKIKPEQPAQTTGVSPTEKKEHKPESKIPKPPKYPQAGKVEADHSIVKKVQKEQESETGKKKLLLYSIIALLFFLGGFLVYFEIKNNSRVAIPDEENEIFKSQLANNLTTIFQLKQELEKSQTLEQVFSIQEDKDAISDKIVEIEGETRSSEILSEIKNVKSKLSELQQKIQAKETSFGAALPKTYQNKLGMEFVLIKPGSFMMGSPEDEPGHEGNESLHQVTLTKAFYMQTTEVTQGQWQDVIGENPSFHKNFGENCPVEKVSWEDVQKFIRKLNELDPINHYELPTEVEWEYACRAGNKTRYCFGDEKDLLADYAWYNANSGLKTQPVGRKKPNARGVYDMHGNVAEWCQDWYAEDYYLKSPEKDPLGPETGADRVVRGGSWGNYARGCRSARRYGVTPDGRYDFLGFRLVLRPGQQGEGS